MVTFQAMMEWQLTPVWFDWVGQFGRADVMMDWPTDAAVNWALDVRAAVLGVIGDLVNAAPLDSISSQCVAPGDSKVTVTVPPTATHSVFWLSLAVTASTVGQPAESVAAGVPALAFAHPARTNSSTSGRAQRVRGLMMM